MTTYTAGTAASSNSRPRGSSRRDQILEVAVQLFYERGYHGTGIDDIGRAAGISGPGVYRHFKSKEDILRTVMDKAAGQVLGKVHAIVGHPRRRRRRSTP